jgi:DNA-binding response OmpR family regulator
MNRKRILVVDDEPEIGVLIKTVAETKGFDVEVTTDGEAFKSSFVTRSPDIIFMDIAIPDCDGLELMEFLAVHRCEAPIVVMSGGGDYFLSIGQAFAKRHQLRVIKVLEKPFRGKELVEFLNSIGSAERSPA